MNARAIALLLGLALSTTLASTGAAQGAPSASASPKPRLAEIRSTVHALQGHTDQLRELLVQYRALLERRPQAEGQGPEAKKAHDAQLAKWSAALERMLLRIDAARTAVVDAVQRLDQLATGDLPTGLAKDVANARNEAEAERATAEHALAKKEPSARAANQAKPAPPPEKTENHELDDL